MQLADAARHEAHKAWEDAIIAAWKQNATHAELALAAGTSSATVGHVIRSRGPSR